MVCPFSAQDLSLFQVFSSLVPPSTTDWLLGKWIGMFLVIFGVVNLVKCPDWAISVTLGIPWGGARLDLGVWTCIAGWRFSTFYRVSVDRANTHQDLASPCATDCIYCKKLLHVVDLLLPLVSACRVCNRNNTMPAHAQNSLHNFTMATFCETTICDVCRKLLRYVQLCTYYQCCGLWVCE